MNEDRISVKNALIKGDLFTKLSAVIMGAGIAGHRQIVKGAVILLLEIAFFGFMVQTGIHNGMKPNRFMNTQPVIIRSRSCSPAWSHALL